MEIENLCKMAIFPTIKNVCILLGFLKIWSFENSAPKRVKKAFYNTLQHFEGF